MFSLRVRGLLALAAPGFLSWDTLSAELLSNLQRGVNPFKLAPKNNLPRV